MAKVAGDQPVPLWRLFWRMGGWLPLIFASVLLILTLISNSALNLAQRFDDEGIQTTAEVADKFFRETTDSDGDKETTYYLTLDYQTSAGQEIRIDRSVGTGLYDDMHSGATLPIWYLETEPRKIEVSRGENRSVSRVTQIIGGIFGVAMLVSFWFPARRAVAATRARRYGARQEARVTGQKATRYTVNNKYRYRLTWEDAQGRAGESLAYKQEQLSAFPTGSTITIYQGINRAWWTGDVGERIKDW